jgi:hypothetical protein
MYLSIVVVLRNDNYGGNLIERFEYFIKSIDNGINKYNMYNDIEIVLVEWNPPSENETMQNIVNNIKKKYSLKVNVRIITISNEYHISRNYTLPCCEYPGKNVGIKESHGEYVLITNPDIVFPNDFFYFLSTKNLCNNCYYRTTRFDINNTNIYNNLDYEQLIEYCKQNIIKINYANEGNEKLFTNAAGDFILTSRDNFIKMNGFYESNEVYTAIDSIMIYHLFYNGITMIDIDIPIYHIEHDRHSSDELNYNKATEIYTNLDKYADIDINLIYKNTN